MTRRLLAALAVSAWLFPAALSAQGKTFDGEAARLRSLLENASAGERGVALSALARLLQLSGDGEKAAALWEEAAALPEDSTGGRALLEGARLLISLGEFDRAGALALKAQGGGADSPLVREAVYLGTLAGAFKTGDTGALEKLAGEGGFGEFKAPLYYSLWKLSGGEEWKTRLVTELPASPEAKIAAWGGAASAGDVQHPAAAHWLLFPGRESLTLTKSEAVPAAPPETAVEPQPARAGGSASGAAAGDAVLQTGLFSGEENARVMAGRLREAGFQPSITLRGAAWAVTVPAGASMNGTILKLKNAGFEAFPVF
jgi:hypothetical protein